MSEGPSMAEGSADIAARIGRALVTGADGFIGSHLVERLVTLGVPVTALVLYNSFGTAGWLDSLDEATRERITIVPGDIRDPGQMRRVMEGIDTVFHLAALIAIPYSYHAPQSYVDTNVRGTVNLLEAARAAGVRRFIQTSTSEVYGTAQHVPIDERHPLVGQSPYAASKIAADQLAYSFFAAFDLPVVILRPFNTYGPRQSQRAVIPTIITQIAAGSRAIRLGATHPTRDLSFVADTVEGFLLAAAAEGVEGETINLGTGHEIAIGDLARLIAGIMGVEIAIETDDARLRPARSEVERLVADNGKARRLLGFAPRFAGPDGLRRGLERTISWFTDPENLVRYAPHRYQI